MKYNYNFTFFPFLHHTIKYLIAHLMVFIFCGFISETKMLWAQNNAINVTVQVLPPYSNNIHDYIGTREQVTRSFQEKVLITLQNTNPNRSYEVKLIASIEGDNGVEARVNENFQPLRKIIVPAGELKVISGRELAEANHNMTHNDVNYSGFSRNQIRRTGTLPEGNYKICMQAYDYRTNQPLSEGTPLGCSPSIPIAYPDPPVIAYPFDEADIPATEPQALNITWAPAPNLTSDVKYRVRTFRESGCPRCPGRR